MCRIRLCSISSVEDQMGRSHTKTAKILKGQATPSTLIKGVVSPQENIFEDDFRSLLPASATGSTGPGRLDRGQGARDSPTRLS